MVSIPNSVMIKQFFECGSCHGASPCVLAKDLPLAPLAPGVAGTGAAPSIEVCFHHRIWDACARMTAAPRMRFDEAGGPK